MNILGKIVVLRAMEPEDNELVRSMFNDPIIESLVTGWAFPLSKYGQEQWYNKHYGDTDFRFIIEVPEFGAVGVSTLVDIDWKNRRATHGIKLANIEGRPKGIGMDAVMATMRYAFDELGLHRLDGAWFEDNIRSQNLYKKCGWREEGCFREYIYKGGVFKNLIPSGILEKDYRELIQKNHYWEE